MKIKIKCPVCKSKYFDKVRKKDFPYPFKPFFVCDDCDTSFNLEGVLNYGENSKYENLYNFHSIDHDLIIVREKEWIKKISAEHTKNSRLAGFLTDPPYILN